MKEKVTILIALICVFCQGNAQEDMKLWYAAPARDWVEALPIGNGRMGAMVFGGTDNELIQLNEATLWSGGPRLNNVNPDAHTYLQPIRNALAKNDFQAAMDLCKKMQGYFSESFLPMGDLAIKQTFKNKGNVYNYYRDLDISRAVSLTRFDQGGASFSREAFVSFPDSALVVRIRASKSGMLNLDIQIKSQIKSQVVSSGNNMLILDGKAPARLDPNYYGKDGRESVVWNDPNGCNGMRFQTLVKAKTTGGSSVADTDGIHIKDADEVVLYLTSATSYNGPFKCPDKEGRDEKAISQQALDKAFTKPYASLMDAHVADYSALYDRVKFILNDTTNNQINRNMPSDLRLQVYSYGNYDPKLEELYFNYGRYLLISCSRPGGVPANLQGIWNKDFRPPWSSNYTININTQMNYWPAESGNLSELHLPLIEYIKNLSKTGKLTAQEYYKARGWMAHHNSDIWCMSNPVGNCGDGDPVWANWYMGGSWLSQHLWEHYAFTGDKKFLREEAYPVMKGAVLFCLDWLVERNGYLVTAPSTSPENLFWFEGKQVSVSEGTTMDMAIIRNLFNKVIEASEVLQTDEKFRKELIAKKAKLLPYRIGSQGQLLEWSQEYKETDPHHRHLSHLFGLHPGNDISPLKTPELAKAAEKSFELRGDEGTGWSKAWKINFAARLLDGNHAYKMIREILKYSHSDNKMSVSGGTYANFFDAHPPFQIDGNFGATAGIMEMLLQSQQHELHLLPALPDAWPSGKISGLKARGNFEVDMQWNKHQLEEATIKSVIGGKCVLRTSVPVRIEGATARLSKDGSYYVNSFDTEKGKSYQVKAIVK
ncbi:MAG: glycoside hydrolase family 95 protein [Dysgonamonadaceae bacterium]